MHRTASGVDPFVDMAIYIVIAIVTIEVLRSIPRNFCKEMIWKVLLLFAIQIAGQACFSYYAHRNLSWFEAGVPLQLLTLIVWLTGIGPDTRTRGRNGQLLSASPSRQVCASGAATSVVSVTSVLLECKTVFNKNARCPVCACDIDKDPVLCCKCETPHHMDCWEFVKRCATFGCGEHSCRAVSPAVSQQELD